jgi:hypothetical protein
LRFRDDTLGRRAALRADRGQEYEALHLRPFCRPRQLDRRLGIEEAIIILRQSGHGMGDAGRMDDSVDARQRLRHIVGLGEIADQHAGAGNRQRRRPPQQHPQAKAAPRQFVQEMLADESRGSGQRDQRFMFRAQCRNAPSIGSAKA